MIGLLSLGIYLWLSLRVWLRNLRFESPPENVSQYLGKVTPAMLGVCVACYTAILIYDWIFLSWFLIFLFITVVLLIFATGNLWWEIYGAANRIRSCNNLMTIVIKITIKRPIRKLGESASPGRSIRPPVCWSAKTCDD